MLARDDTFNYQTRQTLNMTGRGAAGAPPLRPTTPTDPTLASRRVPRKRAFPIQAFGPGAAMDTSNIGNRQEREAFWDELHRAAKGQVDEVENESLLREISQWEKVTFRDDEVLIPQPTWGYYVFLTAYDETTKGSIARAMENWVKVVQRHHGANVDPPNVRADEVCRRFELNLVNEQDMLESASTDRVRECFRAHVRSLELSNDEVYWALPTRNRVCLVLGANQVQMLANLTFHDDRMVEFSAFDECRVQAVDIAWQRPETTRSKYRGSRDISIVGLGRAYDQLADGVFKLETFIE